MEKGQRFLIFIGLLIAVPIMAWLIALNNLHDIPKDYLGQFLKYAAVKTAKFEDWRLAAVYILAFPITVFASYFMGLFDEQSFKGRAFKKHLRGTKMVTKTKLKNMTSERKKEQVTISGVPIPTEVENLHFLLNGSTGAGKSVTLREMVSTAIARNDRLIIIDPNADMFSKFGKKGDVLLNPFDKRTSEWSIFNEIRNSFDYRAITTSVVPKASDGNSEEWNGYGRIILESAMRVLKANSGGANPSMHEVSQLTTIEDVESMKNKLSGTDAESLFVKGADKALGSARFILSKRLPIFKEMPSGDFSIRDFIEKGEGNLYITWKESQKLAMTPIISAWVEIICTSVLSLPEDDDRRLWLFLDELASLDNIASLKDALTKGRKNGLRVVAGVQSISQLKEIYGQTGATVLMACFRSLIVMGGAKTDAETAKAMSDALGEHEVIRESKNKSRSSGKLTTSTSQRVDKENVVLPSEIASLPNLTGIISFSGEYPISRFKSEYVKYDSHNEPFVDSDL